MIVSLCLERETERARETADQPKLHRETRSQNKVIVNIQTQLLYYVKENEGKIDIEWSRMVAAKTSDLSFIPEIHRVERENWFMSNCSLTHRINKQYSSDNSWVRVCNKNSAGFYLFYCISGYEFCLSFLVVLGMNLGFSAGRQALFTELHFSTSRNSSHFLFKIYHFSPALRVSFTNSEKPCFTNSYYQHQYYLPLCSLSSQHIVKHLKT